MELSRADHSVSPPRVDIPREYNAAEDLIGRNLAGGPSGKTAYIDDARQPTATASWRSGSTASPRRSRRSGSTWSSA